MKTAERPKTPLPSEQVIKDRLAWYLCDPFLTVEEAQNLAGVDTRPDPVKDDRREQYVVIKC